MHSTGDKVTILRSVTGRYATKRFSRGDDGTVRKAGYGNETYFAVEIGEVAGIDDLAALLGSLEDDKSAFVIRGEPSAGVNLDCSRRLLRPRSGAPATFHSMP
jgi:hypothetical protein